ncbi:hypothetical protein HDV05_005136 [Chytridiales sp. JEL 0842]|nr:hypothetical protein HDV05_005136 [Chytridiales sp. JEL 0842]
MPLKYASVTPNEAQGVPSKVEWNVRKIRELPVALAQSGEWGLLHALLTEKFDFFEGLKEVFGADGTVRELHSLLLLGATQKGHNIHECAETLEAMLDFFISIRHILSSTPKHLHRHVMMDHLRRLPRDCSLSRFVERLHSFAYQSSWEKFDTFRADLGPLQNHQKWMTLTRCLMEPSDKAKINQRTRGSIAPEHLATANTTPVLGKDNQEPLTKRPRYEKVEFVEKRCTVDGRDPAQWLRSCIKPGFKIRHQRHTLLATSPDGRYIASASQNGNLCIYESITGIEIWDIPIAGRITCMSFPQDSDRSEYLLLGLTYGGYDHRLVRWSLAKGEVDKTATSKKLGISSPITCCGFICDETNRLDTRAFGLCMNGFMFFWDFEATDSPLLKTLTPDKDDNEMLYCGAAAVSVDGRYVAYGIRNVKLVQCTSNFTVAWSIKLHPKGNQDLRFHCCTRMAFEKRGQALYILSAPQKANTAASDTTVLRNPLKDLLGSASEPSAEWRSVALRLDLTSRKIVTLNVFEEMLTSLSISHDSELLTVGTDSGTFYAIHPITGAHRACESFGYKIISASFIPEPSEVAAADGKGAGHKVLAYKRKTTMAGTAEEDTSPFNHNSSQEVKAGLKHYRLCVGTLNGWLNVVGLQQEVERPPRKPVTTVNFAAGGKYMLILGGEEEKELRSMTEVPLKPQEVCRAGVVDISKSYEEGVEPVLDLIQRARKDYVGDITSSTQVQQPKVPSSSLEVPRPPSATTKKSSSRAPSTFHLLVPEDQASESQSALSSTLDISQSTDIIPAPLGNEDQSSSNTDDPKTTLSIWDTETGKRIGQIDCPLSTIFVDVELSIPSQSGSRRIETVFTGGRDGKVQIWKFNVFGEYDAVFKPPVTNRSTKVDMMELDVLASTPTEAEEMRDEGVRVLSYAFDVNTGMLAVVLQGPRRVLMVPEQFKEGDDALSNPKSQPTLGSNVSDSVCVTRVYDLYAASHIPQQPSMILQTLPVLKKGADGPYVGYHLSWASTSHNLGTPSLQAGCERLELSTTVNTINESTGENPSWTLCKSIEMLQTHLGSDVMWKYLTASCTSSADSATSLLCFGNILYITSIDENPDPATLQKPPSTSSSSAPGPPKCRLRKLKGPDAEVFVGVWHGRKEGKASLRGGAEVVVGCTDLGTVVVWELTNPEPPSTSLRKKQGGAGGSEEGCGTVVGIWHARTVLSGLKVVKVEKESVGNEKEGEASKEKVIEGSQYLIGVWGMNGFVTVLTLKV